MLKKSITFEDFDGNTVTEDHYFHLSKADLIVMEMSVDGGLQARLQKIIDSEDGKSIIEEFQSIIAQSYGVKTDDGRRFVKNKGLLDAFMQSEAYSTLFMELATDDGAAVEFINGIMPKGLSDQLAKIGSKSQQATMAIETPPPPSERVITQAELREMDPMELKSLLAQGAQIQTL